MSPRTESKRDRPVSRVIMDAPLHKEIRRIAAENRRSIGAEIGLAIEHHVARSNGGAKPRGKKA